MFNLNGIELGRFLLGLVSLLMAANLLGYIAERLAIPRVLGEVGGGLVLGPSFMGYFFPETFQWLYLGFPSEAKLFGLLYQLGMILLMFNTGLRFNTRFNKSDGKIGIAIIISSTIIPFIAGWVATYLFNPAQFLGPAQNLIALKIVIAISIGVTSIPVISKIFSDLGIVHSRFAKLIIGIAGIHDIFLWIALAVASSIVNSQQDINAVVLLKSIGITLGFLIFCIGILPAILKKITSNPANILFRSSFLGYFLLILFGLSAIAKYLDIDVMYGALLAGIAIRLSLPKHLNQRVEKSVREISFSFFIPVYFAIVGLELNLTKGFSIEFFVLFLLFATIVQGTVVYMTARLIKCDKLTSINFAAAMNARGGPGIVLATVAYSLQIINQNFFAILVLLALITSWMAGSWLRYVLKSGKLLMPGDENLVITKYQEEVDFYPISNIEKIK
ncbi:sodium:proton exchanger [Bacillus mycoides]|uniref:cation:proton antiporter n=1 Tax=Bacillus mycoides TaxID=1405 RepID=UPI001E536963|nr:cation:proton antiporter [Bacillus mycoides]MCD4644857.1 sodium:proton exchanger [Bacillus mycoides]